MAIKSQYCLLTFSSTHHALRAEEFLEEEGIDLDVVPIPREITAECGLAMRFPLELREKAESILAENKINISGIYTWNKENKLEALRSLVEG